MEDRNDEEVEEWGLLLPPAAVHEGCEVASQVPVPSHRPRIPSRRLVLVDGRGIGSQNCQSPAQEDLLGETASPLHSQVGWAQAVRAPLQADQGRFAALACVDGFDDAVATQPADTPQPHGVEQELPYQRRRLRLLSQSTGVGVGTQFRTITSDAEPMAVADAGITQVDSSGSETESLEFEDWGSHANGNEEVSIQVDDTPLEVREVRNITPAVRVALAELDLVNLSEEFSRRPSLMKNVPHCVRILQERDAFGDGRSKPFECSEVGAGMEVVFALAQTSATPTA